MKKYNIIDFVRDPNLIGQSLSPYQETALRLCYGLDLNSEHQALAREALDSSTITCRVYSEATFICGRRSGKTDRLAANIAVYEAVLGGHEQHLSPGEQGAIVVIAQDMRAAGVLFSYIAAKLEDSPLLKQLVRQIQKNRIDLDNHLSIRIFPCSYRSVRGFSVPVAVLDEVAFFRLVLYQGCICHLSRG